MVEVRKLLTAITRPFKTERFKPTFIRRSYSWKAKIYLHNEIGRTTLCCENHFPSHFLQPLNFHQPTLISFVSPLHHLFESDLAHLLSAIGSKLYSTIKLTTHALSDMPASVKMQLPTNLGYLVHAIHPLYKRGWASS